MKVNPKRRWILAIVAIVVVAGVVGFVAFRADPKDVPPLGILRQEEVNGKERVVFRFDAPKHSGTVLMAMSTVDPFTGNERRPVDGGGDTAYVVTETRTSQGKGFRLKSPLRLEPEQSAEFSVVPPPDKVWRLRCQVAVDDKRIGSVLVKAKWSWQVKSLAPFWRGTVYRPWNVLESELITNAVPIATDTPAR